MTVNGRQKGNAAEREVAALMRDWWRRLEPECEWVRTPLSGGWGGPKLRGEFGAAGDLMTTARRCPFAIEVKRRETWSEKNFFDGKPSPVWGWWRQSQVAAAEMSKVPMLWFRRSRKPWLVMLPAAEKSISRELRVRCQVSWMRHELGSVDVGNSHPIVFLASEVLAVDPERFAS